MSGSLVDELLESSGPGDNQIAEISKLAGRAWELEREMNEVEKYLGSMKAEHRELTEKLMPDAMASAGVAKFETDDGVKIEVRDIVRASLPKETEARARALAYLDSIGAGDIIKHKFDVDIGRGNDEVADFVSKFLQNAGIAYLDKEDVHPQTLSALIRERLNNGNEIDMDVLPTYVGRQAKMKKAAK